MTALLGTAIAVAGLPGVGDARQVQPGPKAVVLDWALAATALALGAKVVGVPAIDYYRQVAVEPAMPDDVVDVGLLFTPNFELLDQLKPDIVVIPPSLGAARPFLARIAPVFTVDLSPGATASVAAAGEGTIKLGQALGAEAQALWLLEETDHELKQAAMHLTSWRDRPFLIASPADDRHLTLFGRGSLFADVIATLSLTNALKEGGFLGGRVTAGLERVATYPEANLVLIDPDGNNAVTRAGAGGVFWQALPAVREHRVFHLPPVMEDGGLPAAARFARLLSAALDQGG